MAVLGTIMGRVVLDVRQAVAAYAALRAQNAKTVYAMRGTGDSFMQAGKSLTVAGVGMLYVFGKVVNAAAEFERKMDFFGAVTDTSAGQMDKLSKFTLQLAQDTIYSADQIAEGMVELGKAGVSATQIMNGVGEAMANLGAAGDIPLAESGQIITSTIQQYDLAAKDAVHVTDLLAGAANASIADITDIGVSLKYVGGVANAAGLTFEDTATAISLLAKAGIRGSTAGTSLRQMIVSLPGATGPATEALQELGIITKNGSNEFYTQEGTLKPLSKVYQILQNHTAGLTAKQKLMYLRTIFNNRALSAAAILTREGAKGFKEMNAAMSKVKAADVAAARLDNLSGDIEILRGNIETLMIQAGGPFQETLRGWVQGLTKLVQAYSNLSPSTQKMIVQTFAITGVVLTAMGVFAMFIGVIARFVAAALKMKAAIMFVLRILSLYTPAVEGAGVATGLLAGPVGWVILALVALGAAFIIAYKKSETFRNFVNGMGAWFMSNVVQPFMIGLHQIIDFFAGLPAAAQNAWNGLRSGVGSVISAVINWFNNLKSGITSRLSAAASAVSSFVGRVVGFFMALPGRVLGFLTAFVGRVTQLFTFRNIGFAIGFMIGTVVRLWLGLTTKIWSIAINLVTRTIGFFARLPGRIAAFVMTMANRAVALFQSFRARAAAATVALVAAVINFFARLPGRVIAFVSMLVNRSVALFFQFRARAAAAVVALVNSVVGFFASLPGRVVAFISAMVSRSISLFNQMKSQAISMARGIASGVVSGIAGIPGSVSAIFGQCVSAIKGVISSAFSAAASFAKGMWDGFKQGLGISSPSFIERAMWQITGVVDQETKKLAKRTLEVQAISKRMASTSFSVGDTHASSGAAGYAKLATAQSANQNRARTLMATSLARTDAARASANQGSSSRMVSGELDISPNGRAFIRGVAQDAVDDNEYYNDSLDGMG